MADMRKWNEKWMWHEEANSWVATYRGIVVEVPGSPEKGPPHFTAEAWVEASPDSTMRSKAVNAVQGGDALLCGACGEKSMIYSGYDRLLLGRGIDVFDCERCGEVRWEPRPTRMQRELWKNEGPSVDACFFKNDGV